MKKTKDGKIGYWAVTAIGIGGMVGGGIFAVLGLAVQLAKGGTPFAFFLAGIVALITSYSYSKLSVSFPSQGGTVMFLDKAFGIDLFTGTMNNLIWISYIVMIALYSYAFGSYAATFFPQEHQALIKHLMISAGILIPTILNMLNAEAIGKAETYIVGIKLTILIFFVAIGFKGVDYTRLEPITWSPMLSLIAGGMIIFVAYEGFELIANTAQDVRDPDKILPRAYYSSVIFVIILYILVAIVTVGVLPLAKIISAKDYALAEAAKPFLGDFGFRLIGVAALLSTLSAINATLYGTARLSYIIAKEGELPKIIEKKVWHKPLEGLFITSGLALLLANLGNLSSISTMGSSGFLIIFAAVNASNFKKAKQTNSSRIIAFLGTATCLFALTALLLQTFHLNPSHIWVLIAMIGLAFIIEAAYRIFKKRTMKLS